ncbi:hypothetical protein [Actinophytocola gossypii]|uniref:Translation initiation factor IF-2 n=1 Tax=Actinophytocola gossypii TaxID=2812003 RepID=A0ABT2JHN8_9PSEU|nr:hypothetical protein [Actinophytocola gossypii]MCT2587397.1 hypothetical protein [Actinophytocola gossypii]
MSLYELDPDATRRRIEATAAAGLRALGETATRSEAIDKQVKDLLERREREKQAMDERIAQAKPAEPEPPTRVPPKPATLALGADEFRTTREPDRRGRPVERSAPARATPSGARSGESGAAGHLDGQTRRGVTGGQGIWPGQDSTDGQSARNRQPVQPQAARSQRAEQSRQPMNAQVDRAARAAQSRQSSAEADRVERVGQSRPFTSAEAARGERPGQSRPFTNAAADRVERSGQLGPSQVGRGEPAGQSRPFTSAEADRVERSSQTLKSPVDRAEQSRRFARSPGDRAERQSPTVQADRTARADQRRQPTRSQSDEPRRAEPNPPRPAGDTASAAGRTSQPPSRPAPRKTLKLGAPEDREATPEPQPRQAPPRRPTSPTDEPDDLSGSSWLR